MTTAPQKQPFEASGDKIDKASATRVGRAGHRAVSRVVTLVLAVGFAVVGVAGAASAHHNTISGTVACASNGGWAVTWKVVNSEQDKSEEIKDSNRKWVVPIGTTLAAGETKTFTETVTSKPSSSLTLTLKAYWKATDVTQTNSGSISKDLFSDNCSVKTVNPPTVPAIDDCGPGNAHYGQVPSGPWAAVTNPDGSVTVTANQGYSFGNGQTVITYPVPADSNQACPVVTPPVVVSPPEVLPVEVRVVRAKARKIDKCGRASDLFKVAKRSGVIYTSRGKVLREGVWLKAKTRKVTVRARTTDASYLLKGKQVWKMTFTRKACAQAPQISPNTGS